MKHLLTSILIICGIVAQAQINLEVDGKAKISLMDTINNSSQIVVRKSDGELAVTNLDEIQSFQVISISNDTIFLSNGGHAILPPGFDGNYDNLIGSPTNLSEFINDAGYLTHEQDSSNTNEIQKLFKSGLKIYLDHPAASIMDSVQSEATIDAMVANNGFLLVEVDGDRTNEIQTINRVGKTVSLDKSGGTFQDSVLTEVDVDHMVANNGYITNEVDGDPLNEIQTINRNGTTVLLSHGGGAFQDSVLTRVDVVNIVKDSLHVLSDFDQDTTNELQVLSAVGDSVFISGGNYIVLPGIDYANTLFNDVQFRLDKGETPAEIYNSGVPLDSIYGHYYEGGYIFYINLSTKRIYVSAAEDFVFAPQLPWGCNDIDLPDLHNVGPADSFPSGPGADIFYGWYNTGHGCQEINSAAKFCWDLEYNGYNDWFLPSILELNQLGRVVIKRGITDHYRLFYSSSTEYDADQYWIATMITSVEPDLLVVQKDSGISVIRPVRSFSY